MNMQEKLFLEANRIEKELQILDILKKYGRAEIVGSVATKLIVNKDLDIHLLTNMNLDCVSKIVFQELTRRNQHININIENFIYNKRSMYLNICDYNGWQIDIWISNDINFVGFDLVKKIKLNITDEKRKIIMELKREYYKNNKLEGEMSTLIYNLVIDDKVKNVNELNEHITNASK